MTTGWRKPIDAKSQCNDIEREIVNMRQKYDREMGLTGQAWLNVFNFAAGFFTLVNWFFIDFSTGRGDVLNSYQEREDYLNKLAIEQSCEIRPTQYRKTAEWKKFKDGGIAITAKEKPKQAAMWSNPPDQGAGSSRPSLF